ncbi:threonine aldolase family protein [Urechidicola croceus]|uniref:Threonine aldolase n=1 Tax=Urechidicola croceus TaxID=1850246 RepID=A0A1D8P4E2_9FLAO|nr:GntG family PLP-dependent aldolase [Urechidicola croceus]AOW19454.1 threonine aldolase [Urechidicola croceus]
MEINLISDTVTKPTPDMLSFMMNAKVGDDVFGQDPTVNELQDKTARLFGKEAALFFPSGTMANQSAIKLHTNPGEQLICDKWAHVFNYEGGGASFNSGVSCALIDGTRGMFKAEQVEKLIHDPNNIHIPVTSLVTLENTTNKGGGGVWDINEIKNIKKVCSQYHLPFHLDGARLFNALTVTGETPKQYGELFDTISICLSKGLGAPVGSLLLGSHKHINKALRIRKLFGGNMRQIGYLAAAGIYALDNNVERLKEDHRKAKVLGEVLNSSPLIKKVEQIETNIVIFYVNDNVDENEFVNKLVEKNILLISMGEGKLRMVTHLDFTDEMLDKTISEIKNLKLLV